MKTLKVRLEKTTRTDLVCIGCGGFRTEYAIVSGVVEGESVAGVHRDCIADVHVRRAASTATAASEGEAQ